MARGLSLFCGSRGHAEYGGAAFACAAGSVSDASSAVLTNKRPLTASWAPSRALGSKELGHHTVDLAQA